jgi:hypothetical protein
MTRGSDVFPGNASPNVIDGGWMYSQQGGQSPSRKRTGFDHDDFSGGQFGVAAGFTEWDTVTLQGIGVVIGIVPGTKMNGLDADGAVAGMEDAQSVGNLADKQTISSSMGFDFLGYAFDVHVEIPISGFVSVGSPIPTALGGRGGRWGIARHEPAKRFGLVHALWALIAGPTEGISMSAPTQVVGVAETTAANGASADIATHFCSIGVV